jgi:hypothetical protein
MEKAVKTFEDWFLDSFMPFLEKIGMFVGILAIEAGLAFILKKLFRWNFEECFIGIIFIGGCLFVTFKDSRLKRRIRILLKDQESDIELVVKGNLIDYSIYDKVVNRTVAMLNEEGFKDCEDGRGELRSEVKKMVWEHPRRGLASFKPTDSK